MSQTTKSSPLRGICLTTRISAFLLLALVLVFSKAAAQTQDDEYLRIHTMIQEADSLNSNGKTSAALAKYQQAETALQKLKKNYPEWNAKVIAFRTKYLNDQITALSDKLAAPAEAQPGKPGSASGMKLGEAGAEPRKALRLHPKPDDKQPLKITLKISTEIKTGEMQAPAMKFPAIIFDLELTVKSAPEDGDIAYELALNDTTVGDEAGSLPQIAEMLKTSLANLKGLSGSGTMSSRGVNKEMEVKLPEGADPQLHQIGDQLKEILTLILIPLPEEPVGVGAKWSVKGPVKTQGVTIDQTANYQLTAMDGERLTIKAIVAQTAANQKMESPAMPGMKLDLAKMTGSGNAELVVDLAQLLPGTGTIDGRSESAFTMAGQKMTTRTETNVRLESK